jgi:head-tail adaptor
MALLTAQQKYNIQRRIDLLGRSCRFLRSGSNAYGEPTETTSVVHTCNGLFHSADNGHHIEITLEDKGTTQTKKRPRLLIAYTDAVKLKDTVEVNGRTFVVTGLEDIGNEGAFLEISLGGDFDD